jgi:hypothetical protein
MKQQDINAITSFVFSKYGQAFYLQSPSEFLHISMSARDTLLSNINLKSIFRGAVRDESVEQLKAKAKNKAKSATLPTQPQDAPVQPLENHNERVIPSPTSPPPPIPAPRASSNRDVVNSRYVLHRLLACSEPKAFNRSKASITTLLTLKQRQAKTLSANCTDTATNIIANTNSTNNGLNAPTDDTKVDTKQLPPPLPATQPPATTTTVTSLLSRKTPNSVETTTTTTTTSLNKLNESSSFNNTDYNGSTSGISSTTFTSADISTVDLSMDSIVDKFNDE